MLPSVHACCGIGTPPRECVSRFLARQPMRTHRGHRGYRGKEGVQSKRLTASLCAHTHMQVWALRCDMHVLDHGGNLVDACMLCALAACLAFRRPEVVVGGGPTGTGMGMCLEPCTPCTQHCVANDLCKRIVDMISASLTEIDMLPALRAPYVQDGRVPCTLLPALLCTPQALIFALLSVPFHADIVVQPKELREPIPLTIHHYPVSTTFALFEGILLLPLLVLRHFIKPVVNVQSCHVETPFFLDEWRMT
eukprot:1157305-Pelagomonas_calceolata.AAC.10